MLKITHPKSHHAKNGNHVSSIEKTAGSRESWRFRTRPATNKSNRNTGQERRTQFSTLQASRQDFTGE
jgi:hypothetical protein